MAIQIQSSDRNPVKRAMSIKLRQIKLPRLQTPELGPRRCELCHDKREQIQRQTPMINRDPISTLTLPRNLRQRQNLKPKKLPENLDTLYVSESSSSPFLI